MPQYWTVPKREMHTDMFLLVVCYASAWSCLCCFPSSVWNLSRFKEDSFHLQCLIDCEAECVCKSMLPVCAVSPFQFGCYKVQTTLQIHFWRKQVQQSAQVGFSFLFACWCSLLCLIFHVRLSLASCRVECWVTSVWCQVSWCLHCCKARLTHTSMYKEFTRANRQTHTQNAGGTHTCMWHAYCTCMHKCMHARIDCRLYRGSSLFATWSITPTAIRSTAEAFLPNNWRRG